MRRYPERFQAVGRAVDKRLLELGATAIVPRGEGDDNGGIDNDFALWQSKVVPELEERLGMRRADDGK